MEMSSSKTKESSSGAMQVAGRNKSSMVFLRCQLCDYTKGWHRTLCPWVQQWHRCYGVTSTSWLYSRPVHRRTCILSTVNPAKNSRVGSSQVREKPTISTWPNTHGIKRLSKFLCWYPSIRAARRPHQKSLYAVDGSEGKRTPVKHNRVSVE